jgi:hypothetical protein
MTASVPIAAAALASDTAWAVTVAEDGTVRTWATGLGASISPGAVHLEVGGPVAVAFSDPVLRVFWVSEGMLRLYERGPGARPGFDAIPAPAPVCAVALSPSARVAVVACEDGTLRGLDMRTGEFGWTVTTGAQRVLAVAVAADEGPVVASLDDGSIWRYDLGAGTSAALGVGPPVHSIAISPDGEVVVTAGPGGVLSRSDPPTGALSEIRTLGQALTAVAVDGTGNLLLVGTDDGRLWLHDLTGGPSIEYIVPTGEVAAPPVEAPPPPLPPVVDDDVRFTVYRPQALFPGQWASLLVYAHKTTLVEQPGRPPIDPIAQVETQARAHFGGSPPHPIGGDAQHDLARGAQLRIAPDLPGIQCNPPARTIDWWEPVHEVEFRLLAGADLAGTVVRGAVRVWCGPLILAEVSIAVHVAEDGSAGEPPSDWQPFVQYRKIFPSYSHLDGAVVARFAEAARALGDEYLQDVLTLRAGEPWNPRLLELIEDADVFQLFWSRNSMRSPHCRDEWEHALALGRPLFIRPLYWEEPMPKDPGQGLPPDALRRLHFVKVPAEHPAATPTPSQQSRPSSGVRIFINYRREDTWGEALLLYDRLAGRFGTENVFLDSRSLRSSMEWLEESKSQATSSTVFLSLIGPRWTAIMKARAEEITHPSEDYVRFELEYALSRGPGIRVIPVLVGDDRVPFNAAELPKGLQPLTKIEAEDVRPKRFEEDLARLMARLETVTRQESPAPVPPPEVASMPAARAETLRPGVPPPDDAHYRLVLQHMVDEGNLVPFLGWRQTGRRAGPGEAPGPSPDADEIAADLAERFGLKSMGRDLPAVAQYVYVTRGRPDLYRALRQILTAYNEPGPVHRFLARFPQLLAELGAGPRYQLIVSTSFDTGLEQAFDDEAEPYDLAIYMASGPDKGKFVHFPFGGPPEPISVPNAYGKLPFTDYGELERTMIVKIHGAVDGQIGGYRWKENYLITEDQYIDYLSKSPIESLIPQQILNELKVSHLLFLGYPVRDWSQRAFLRKLWDGGEPSSVKSWAVEPYPDLSEKELWAQSYVDLYTADLTEYVHQLMEHLINRTQTSD